MVRGHIADASHADRYPLDLGGAKSFYVLEWKGPGPGCDQSLTINLVDVSVNNFPCTNGSVHFTALDPIGRYNLDIASAKGGTGQYSFRLVTEKVRPLSIAVAERITAGNLDIRGRVDIYTFSAAGRSAVQLNATDPSCASDVTFIVRNATTNASVTSDRPLCRLTRRIELPDATGRYTITISSPTIATGTYSFSLDPA